MIWLVLGWVLIACAYTYSTIFIQSYDVSGFMVECSAHSNWMIAIAVLVGGIVIFNLGGARNRGFVALGLASIALFAAGFNVGGVLCPDHIFRPPTFAWPF